MRLDPTEFEIQSALVEWCRLNEVMHPELALLYAIPNEGIRTFNARRRRKAEGMKAGVPDLCLPIANEIWGGLYLECKSKKGRLSSAQKWWIEALRLNGHCVEVFYSLDEGIDYLKAYLRIPKGRKK